MSGFDSNFYILGIENNEYKAIAKRKALIGIVFCIVLCTLMFVITFPSSQEKEIKGISRTKSKKIVNLNARFEYEGEVYDLNTDITVKGLPSVEVEENVIEESFLLGFAEDTIKNLSKSTDGSILTLPTEKDGVFIRWTLPKEKANYWLFVVAVILSLFLYFGRFDEINKRDKRYKEEILSELPNMVSQICLYLNAGLIAESAFKELVDRNSNSKKALYISLKQLNEISITSNTSFISQFYLFAQRTGIRELIRFASMVKEHIGRGSELVSKLENENAQQYQSRLILAKAKVKAAETKLCFPLMLLLISLVIICVFPAMSGL